jgi:putative AlgH/UPF0301 family transcriptional regulator
MKIAQEPKVEPSSVTEPVAQLDSNELPSESNPKKKSENKSTWKAIYFGGSRLRSKYVVLYNPQQAESESTLKGQPMCENVSYSIMADKNVLNDSISSLPRQSEYRVFQGYELFSTKVLEKELYDGAYIISHLSRDTGDARGFLVDPPALSSEEMWTQLLSSMGGEFAHFGQIKKKRVHSYQEMEQKINE